MTKEEILGKHLNKFFGPASEKHAGLGRVKETPVCRAVIDAMEEYTQQQVKLVTTPVDNKSAPLEGRDLLIAFIEWCAIEYLNLDNLPLEIDVDDFLKAINCYY